MRKTLLTAASLTALMLSGTAHAAKPLIKVTLLGTGVPLLNANALEINDRALSGLLVEAGSERILFDCGQGVYRRLLEVKAADLDKTDPPFQPSVLNPYIGVDKVFISHLHSDHIADLAALYSLGALYRHPEATDLGFTEDLKKYPFPTTTPLKVWGPSAGPNQPVGTWAMMQSLRNAYESDFYVRALWAYDPVTGQNTWDASVGYPSVDTINNTTELTDGAVYKLDNGARITAFTVNHEPVTPSYGFRVDYKGHSVVYSGDTAPTPNIIKYGKNVDVLVHEVYGYARDDSPNIYDYHTSPEDAANIFKQTKPKQAVFTHLVIPPGTSADDLVTRTTQAGYKGKLKAGTDLMVITVNDDNTVKVKEPANAKATNARKARGRFAEM
jgi:ribonuclease Z